MAVKGNQGTLYEDLTLLFEGFGTEMYQDVRYDTARTRTQAHGREEYRQIWVVAEPEYRHYLRQHTKWTNLHSLIKLVTVRYLPDKDKMETSTGYFISSWQAKVDDFLKAIRDHWQIENGLHWVLDVTFREDDSRIRSGDAPQNMAVLRTLALNILKRDTSKASLKQKRFRAGLDDNFLQQLLSQI